MPVGNLHGTHEHTKKSMIQCKVSVFDFDFFPSSMEPKLREVRVKSDFISRNQRELTVRKGEIVQVSAK